ncbi:RNA-directed DNA polymerase from mobile element jockey [Merluccius polli]|uniref:RNA-directed DNA polymerase from mobile element jockey n=1 Tax=Merluccius polli TaxID=89951 RepID=A0AA47MVY6_MERPO|nr:RNA-directed DNA polymerase from mobile element jockey [Merluccius polli]
MYAWNAYLKMLTGEMHLVPFRKNGSSKYWVLNHFQRTEFQLALAARVCFVYRREQLIALRSAVVFPRDRHELPPEILRKTRHGCCAGKQRREKKRRFRPVLPSVTMGNVRSLPNKTDELAALTRYQREYRESSVLLFTETWLTPSIPDATVMLDNFQLLRADRTADSGKGKGGGLAVFVNERWCKPTHCTVKAQLCSKDIELLAVSMRPYYLPREFSHAIVIAAYVPPSAKVDIASDALLSVTSKLQTQHPQALFLISGDFNHASPSSVLPTCTQYVNCPTRDNKTLDLFYANTKEAYSASPLPPLGRADHNIVHLQPVYKPTVHRQPVVPRTVKRWTAESDAALRDCFNTTVWTELCDPHGEDIITMTDCITDYINFCFENTVPSRVVRCFSNNKPWINPDIKALLKEKKRAFRSGNKDELRTVQKELRRKTREGKASYRRKMEEQLQRQNIRGVWRSLETILGYKTPHEHVEGDRQWVNDLNLHFNRFDQAPTPPPMQPHVFNLSLELRVVPQIWKTSCVVPVPKTSHPKDLSSYKPVALTSHLMKTLERLILGHLRSEVGPSMDPLQFAYHPNVGVEDAVIFLQHRALSHLEKPGSTVRITFFDFSSAFNTIQPVILRDNLERMGVDHQLSTWILDYLTDQPQFVRNKNCVSDLLTSSTGAPQGTVLAPFLFTLYKADFRHNTDSCVLQKFSNDSAIVGLIRDDDDAEYRGLAENFVDWCQRNHLLINVGKTKEMVVDFRRCRSALPSPVNIQGMDIEQVDSYKYLGVHLNTKLDWTGGGGARDLNTPRTYGRRGRGGCAQ